LHAANATVAGGPAESGPADGGPADSIDERSTLERAEIRIKRLNEVAIGELCVWLSAAKLLFDATR
jgi:hypothetical protein